MKVSPKQKENEVCDKIRELCDQLEQVKKDNGNPTETLDQLEMWLNKYWEVKNA